MVLGTTESVRLARTENGLLNGYCDFPPTVADYACNLHLVTERFSRPTVSRSGHSMTCKTAMNLNVQGCFVEVRVGQIFGSPNNR